MLSDIQPPRRRFNNTAQNQPKTDASSIEVAGKPDPQEVAIELSHLPDEPSLTVAQQGRLFSFRRMQHNVGVLESGSNFLTRWLYKRWTAKRIIFWIVILLLLGAAAFGYRIFSDLNKTFKGNVFGAIVSAVTPDKPLKIDQYGNTNVLLLGTMESDPNHPGAIRTNSMMIASINKAKQTTTLLSIPRDLWVKGDAANPCVVGSQFKINAVYECELGTHFKDGSWPGLSPIQNDETTAENKTAAIVGKTVGVDVGYVVHMNLTVVQQVVDAVGGIDITIQSSDSRGILDRNFDWRCHYQCYLVKYPNGPAHLDGPQALWLSQARNDTVAPQYVGYGLPRGNFDREDNQRKIVMATKDKATGIGFLANPLNIVNLMDAAGDNLHTTIDSSEVKSFVNEAKSIPSNNITSLDIQNVAPNILTTGWSPDGTQSIVMPTAGLYNYSQLQAFMSQVIQGKVGLVKEAAQVDVLNSSGISGAAAQEANQLQRDGFTVGKVASTPTTAGGSAKYTLYDLSQGKDPATLTALQKELGVSTTSTTLPTSVTSTAPFVVILGDSHNADSSSSGSNP